MHKTGIVACWKYVCKQHHSFIRCASTSTTNPHSTPAPQQTSTIKIKIPRPPLKATTSTTKIDIPAISKTLLERIEQGKAGDGLTHKEFASLSAAKDVWRCMTRVFLNSKLASKLLSFLIQRNNGGVNLFMYNRLIASAVVALKMDVAEMLFDQMLLDKIPPDTTTYNHLIRGYMSESLTSKAARMFQQIQKNGLKPDARTYTLMLAGHLDNSQIKEAHAIFDDMKAQLLDPSVHSTPTSSFEHFLKEYKQDSQMDINKWYVLYLCTSRIGHFFLASQGSCHK